jgi:hypothetical protein
LGMPVHLVTIGKHYFIRWEEPGYRMNIEPTIVERVSVSPDDTVYLETEGVTREQLRGSDLRNLTHREVVGNLLFARSAYWATKGPEYADRQHRDLARARQLAPDDVGIKETYEAVINRAGRKPAPVSIQPKPSANIHFRQGGQKTSGWVGGIMVRSDFDQRMFPPLPGGEGRGEGERCHTLSFSLPKKNVESPGILFGDDPELDEKKGNSI